MIIGTKRLLELVKDINLVEGLCKRELTNPEGAGFDFRVGEIFTLSGEGFLGVQQRSTPETTSVAKYGKDKFYMLKPRECVLVRTIESVNLPENMIMAVAPRTTLLRSGVALIHSNTAPGYHGKLNWGLKNLRDDASFKLSLGARIALVQFYETTENISQYRGQWNGGRVSSEGKRHRQV